MSVIFEKRETGLFSELQFLLPVFFSCWKVPLRPLSTPVVLVVDQRAQLMRLHKLTKLSNESSSPCSTFHAHKFENRQFFSTSSATILLFFFISTNQRRGFFFLLFVVSIVRTRKKKCKQEEKSRKKTFFCTQKIV